MSVKTYPSKIDAGLVKLKKLSSKTRPETFTIDTHYGGPRPHPNSPEADEVVRDANDLFAVGFGPKVCPIQAAEHLLVQMRTTRTSRYSLVRAGNAF